jgi:cytokinin dehydrogenase
MATDLDRRRFLAGVLAGVAVIAFDPWGRSWVTAASAADGPVAGSVPVPELDGELVTDPAALAEAADDFGHIVHRTPVAVLRPGSVADIVAIVRYANRHGIAVAMRGQGHATFGQAQVRGGIVIDSRTLATIGEVSAGGAVVDAGVRWLDVLLRAADDGLTAPVFTDYLELSVGGTLGLGGIGGTTHRHGLQVDNVLELDVVTGDGQLRRCSPHRDRLLFESVLGGLGQAALIVRARIALVPAPERARSYQLFYPDLGGYLRDQQRVLADGRFSSQQGQVVPIAGGDGWEFFIDAAAYYTPPDVPDDDRLLAGLGFDPARTVIADQTYVDWVNRLAPVVELLKQLGLWLFPHPWFNVFLPASRTRAYVERVLADLTPADTGQGPVLLYPFSTGRLHRPLVQVPRERTAFLFALLRTAIPPEPSVVDAQVAANRTLFERARAIGGKQYPAGSIPFSRADWVGHFGVDYALLAAAKVRYDPRRVLTPGQGIF